MGTATLHAVTRSAFDHSEQTFGLVFAFFSSVSAHLALTSALALIKRFTLRGTLIQASHYECSRSYKDVYLYISISQPVVVVTSY